MQPISTERLIIRELTEGDAAFILDLYNQPSFIENIGDRGIHSLADAKNWIESTQVHYRDKGFWLYGVALKETGQLVGVNGLVQRECFEVPDIGFAFLPGHCRQGYAYESCQPVIQRARSLGFPHIVAITSPHNHASQQLLLKCGFEQLDNVEVEPNDWVNLFKLPLT